MSEKRPTEIKDKERIAQSFNPEKFNFTRVNKNEVNLERYRNISKHNSKHIL